MREFFQDNFLLVNLFLLVVFLLGFICGKEYQKFDAEDFDNE